MASDTKRSRPRLGVVMAGGSGERFWPQSRPERPKQLLRLTHPTLTMLEEAILRLQPTFRDADVFVSTSAALRDPILGAKAVPDAQVISEPARRNTLGAQCWAVANFMALGLEDATVAMLTADHMIGEDDRFRATIAAAMEVAEEHGGIVTLGIPPTRPETGYGYIEEDRGSAVLTGDGRTAYRAHSFREKPSPETAEYFLEQGTFLWNGGMFFFTVETFLRELAHAQPLAHASTLAMAKALKQGDLAGATAHFEALPNISIDYAVMEKAEVVYVLRADFPWDDVGAWDAVERSRPKDARGNVVEGRTILLESRGTIVLNENADVTVGAIGLDDMVVVVTHDAILICPKDDVQRVRLIAQAHAQTP